VTAIGHEGTRARLLRTVVVAATAIFAAACVPSAPEVVGFSVARVVVMVLSAALVVAVAVAGRDPRFRTPVAVVALLLLGVALLWSVGIVPSPQSETRSELQSWFAAPIGAETYAFDGGIYLRTRELMEEGVSFYRAFGQAVRDDQRHSDPPASALNYREPALFWLWTLLPGPPVASTVLAWYFVLAYAMMVAAFLLARRFVEDAVALLGPFALLPHIASASLAMSWFAFAETWAAILIVLAFALLAHHRLWPSVIALLVAVAFRELAIVFVPAWVVAWWLGGAKKRMLPGTLVAVLAPVAIIVAHVVSVPAEASGSLNVAPWLVGGGIPRLIRALQHGAEYGPLSAYLQPALLLLALAGAALVKTRWLRWSLLTGLIVPAAFLTVFSAGEFDYYWGAILIPLTAALAPLAFQRLAPASIPPEVMTSNPRKLRPGD
jgi:hypothetical protein